MIHEYDYNFAIFWIVLFLLIVLFSYLYTVYPTIKTKTTAKVTQFKNKLTCKKFQNEAKLNAWTIYLWANSKRVLIINFAFIALFFFSVFLYLISGVWLYFITFIVYLVSLKFQYKWYKEFPKIAEEKLKEHEQAIKSALLKSIQSSGDKVEEILRNIDNIKGTPLEYLAHLETEIIEQATDIQKFDFPPFIKLDGPRKKVIKSRKMQYFVLTRDFILAALNPTPFDLLNPKRAEEKKQCVLVRAVGPTRDYYYSMIRRVYYDDEEKGIKIEFFDSEVEPPVLMKVPTAVAAKDHIFKIKERLRLLERQRLAKVDEIYKFYAIKDTLKVSVEDIKDSSGSIKVDIEKKDNSEEQEEDNKK